MLVCGVNCVSMDWNDVEHLFSIPNFEDDCIAMDHDDLTNRITKTFYYAPKKNPAKDPLPFPVTKAAVESFRKAAPLSYGKLGLRFASRLSRDACASPCAMLLAMIYVDRLMKHNPDYLQRLPSSDLFLVTMMVASKYLFDEGSNDEVYNDEWAASGLVKTDYMNDLEAGLLQALDWRIFVSRNEFRKHLLAFEARLAFVESSNRGWISYTEALSIVRSQRVSACMIDMLALASKVVCFTAFLYGTVVMTTAVVAACVRPAVLNVWIEQQPVDVNRGFNRLQPVMNVTKIASDLTMSLHMFVMPELTTIEPKDILWKVKPESYYCLLCGALVFSSFNHTSSDLTATKLTEVMPMQVENMPPGVVAPLLEWSVEREMVDSRQGTLYVAEVF